MGHQIYYGPERRNIGNVSVRRWEEVSKLLPLMLDYVNRAQREEWGPGIIRDVRLYDGGKTDPPPPPPDMKLPPSAPFEGKRMLSEEGLGVNELCFYEAEEWKRLFAWGFYLEAHDGAFELYVGVMKALHICLREIRAGGKSK